MGRFYPPSALEETKKALQRQTSFFRSASARATQGPPGGCISQEMRFGAAGTMTLGAKFRDSHSVGSERGKQPDDEP